MTISFESMKTATRREQIMNRVIDARRNARPLLICEAYTVGVQDLRNKLSRSVALRGWAFDNGLQIADQGVL